MVKAQQISLFACGKFYMGKKQSDVENLSDAKTLIKSGMGDYVVVPWNNGEYDWLIVRRDNYGHGPGIEVVWGSTDKISGL